MRSHQLPLAFECSRSLAEMPARAGGRQRWCDGCARTVHDLSLHSEAEARALLEVASEQLCVAYRVDARGVVQFGRRPLRDRMQAALASTALLVAAGCVGAPDRAMPSQLPELGVHDVQTDSPRTVYDFVPEPEYLHLSRSRLGGLDSSAIRGWGLQHEMLEQMTEHAEQDAPK
jgi:hypothetical protein